MFSRKTHWHLTWLRISPPSCHFSPFFQILFLHVLSPFSAFSQAHLHNCIFYSFPICTFFPVYLHLCPATYSNLWQLDFFLILLLYPLDFSHGKSNHPSRGHSASQKVSYTNTLTIITVGILRIYIRFNGGFFSSNTTNLGEIFFFHQHNKPKSSNQKQKISNIFNHKETKMRLIQPWWFLSPRHIIIPQNLSFRKIQRQNVEFLKMFISAWVFCTRSSISRSK